MGILRFQASEKLFFGRLGWHRTCIHEIRWATSPKIPSRKEIIVIPSLPSLSSLIQQVCDAFAQYVPSGLNFLTDVCNSVIGWLQALGL